MMWTRFTLCSTVPCKQHRWAAQCALMMVATSIHRPNDTTTAMAEGAEKETITSTVSRQPTDGPSQRYHQPTLPYPEWDYDWDSRNSALSKKGLPFSGRTRHILLVRHGQYDETHGDDDIKQGLTALGRRQAEITGKRLASMAKSVATHKNESTTLFEPCWIVRLQSSTRTRAVETAQIIAQYLDPTMVAIGAPDPLLDEGLPAVPIIPIRPDVEYSDHVAEEDHQRIETAFRKYFYRANAISSASENDPDDHEFEVIVCHANVIRYFFLRALQLPPESWLRMSVFNCSLTYLMIKPNGYVTCRMLGDIGHLGYEYTTFSGNHGLAWS